VKLYSTVFIIAPFNGKPHYALQLLCPSVRLSISSEFVSQN